MSDAIHKKGKAVLGLVSIFLFCWRPSSWQVKIRYKNIIKSKWQTMKKSTSSINLNQLFGQPTANLFLNWFWSKIDCILYILINLKMLILKIYFAVNSLTRKTVQKANPIKNVRTCKVFGLSIRIKIHMFAVIVFHKKLRTWPNFPVYTF